MRPQQQLRQHSGPEDLLLLQLLQPLLKLPLLLPARNAPPRAGTELAGPQVTCQGAIDLNCLPFETWLGSRVPLLLT